MYRIGIDIGGTFTDLVAVNDKGVLTSVKVASTPQDQSQGVLEGLAQLADELGLPLSGLLADTQRIVHGMTVATNALLERKGAKVALLTTEGHRDVLEMREGLKPERYNLRLARREPLVPRRLRIGVKERMKADGTVETPLDRASLEKAVKVLKREKVDAVAVCYLHAYKDARHEQETIAILQNALPGAYITLSSDVLPQIKEYERVSTTVVNAYVGPLIRRYLARFEELMRDAGYGGPVLIVLSHGGVAPVEEAIRIAAATVLSGPAGGLAGARHVARLLDIPDLVPFDMGGTSSDISLVVGGAATLSNTRSIAHERIALPSLDIVTLGAGGGSIAKTDGSGLLTVGPQSAGAVPGPACYGRGGTEPTVTDASVVLGYLDPEHFLGGRAALDRKAAEDALDRLATALGIERIKAAEGVHRVVNTQMAEGIRLATVRQGVDPRGFALLGFGGAAALHASELARLLNISRVIVPRVASVLSAWGMLATELRYEISRSHIGETGTLNSDRIRNVFDDLEAAGKTRLEGWFDGTISHIRSADMRYGEQIFEIDVALDQIDFTSPNLLEDIKRAFEARHRDLYTYALEDQEPIVINARVATVGALEAPPQPRARSTGRRNSEARTREIYLGGWVSAQVLDFDGLSPGNTIAGPAVIEANTTTVLLRPGDVASVTQQGWLDIAVGG